MTNCPRESAVMWCFASFWRRLNANLESEMSMMQVRSKKNSLLIKSANLLRIILIELTF